MKNSKRIVTVGRGRHAKTRVIKSDRALAYSEDVLKQVGFLREPLRGPIRFTAWMYYHDDRKDLDAALLIDLLQKRVYANDNQIVEIHLHRKKASTVQDAGAELCIEELE
jgi:Holliday junction resolvase RusA-like endonuclease